MTPETNKAAAPSNLPAERPPRPPLAAAGGQVTAIIPRSVEEMFRIADAISKSGLAPNTLNTPQKVTVAIMAGAELGMPPYQAVQSFAVIGNRATIWGDAIPALLWSRGFKIKEWIENSDPAYPDNMVAKCLVTRPDGEEIEGEFSVADAREANLWTKSGPWQTAKKRMLKMRARAFAARDGAADVLRGMQIREEVEDYAVDVTPGRAPGRREEMLARMQEHQHQGAEGGFDTGHVAQELGGEVPHDPDTGEIQEAEFEDATERGGPATSADEERQEAVVDDPQTQGSTATGSSELTSEPKPTSTSGASTGTSVTGSPSGTGSTERSLADKASDYERRLRGASDTIKLTSIRNANAKLREAVAREMPERGAELDGIFNELYVQLEDKGER